MTLRLRLKVNSTIPIVVQGVLPETVAGLSLDKLAGLEILHGNRQVALDSLFEIEAEEPSSDKNRTSLDKSPVDAASSGKNLESEQVPELHWLGDLSCVHWIGAKMGRGKMVISANAGRHLGSQMSGGDIVVHGDAGDFVGCEMTGGSIRVNGDAADWFGAAYPGSKLGVNRGQLVVTGNVGRGVGMSLRRGTICVGGNAGPLAGWNMRAGTLIIGGQAGEMLGKGMRRGTILLSATASGGNGLKLPPTFTAGGPFQSAAIRTLARWTQEQEFPVTLSEETRMEIYHGDHLRGGRGEVLVAAGREQPQFSE